MNHQVLWGRPCRYCHCHTVWQVQCGFISLSALTTMLANEPGFLSLLTDSQPGFLWPLSFPCPDFVLRFLVVTTTSTSWRTWPYQSPINRTCLNVWQWPRRNWGNDWKAKQNSLSTRLEIRCGWTSTMCQCRWTCHTNRYSYSLDPLSFWRGRHPGQIGWFQLQQNWYSLSDFFGRLWCSVCTVQATSYPITKCVSV